MALSLHIDTGGTLERVTASVRNLPAGVERAKKRALRKLATWVQRAVLREAATAAGTTQKVIKALNRYSVRPTQTGIVIWVGTNPIKAHHLGKVTWTPRMSGARVGRRAFPGGWSWDKGKTQGLVMRRTGSFGRNGNPRLERIDVVRVPIDDPVRTRLEQMEPDIAARLMTLFRQELNYALRIERAA